jgi:hypothetical protein
MDLPGLQYAHDFSQCRDMFRVPKIRRRKLMSQNATTAATVVTARAARVAALATKKAAEVSLASAAAAKLLADAVYQAALEGDDRPAK